MLGMNEKREPVKGEFVRVVIDSMKRAFNGEMTEEEYACENRLDKAHSMYNFVW